MDYSCQAFLSPTVLNTRRPAAPTRTLTQATPATCFARPPAKLSRREALRVAAGALGGSLALGSLLDMAYARGVPPGTLPSTLRGDDLPKEWPFAETDFDRVDTKPDRVFYDRPRITRHIDDDAVAALTAYMGRTVREKHAHDVLDLCASVESYLPAEGWAARKRVAGVGLNAVEMDQNPSLTEFSVVDLNEASKPVRLPYGDNEFDVCLCAMSIDYLTRPREVLSEVARVLRPGGEIVVAFSDRLFMTKAVALWTGDGDAGHIDTVATYIAFAGGFNADQIEVADLSPRRKGVNGDPLYVVQAPTEHGRRFGGGELTI